MYIVQLGHRTKISYKHEHTTGWFVLSWQDRALHKTAQNYWFFFLMVQSLCFMLKTASCIACSLRF